MVWNIVRAIDPVEWFILSPLADRLHGICLESIYADIPEMRLFDWKDRLLDAKLFSKFITYLS